MVAVEKANQAAVAIPSAPVLVMYLGISDVRGCVSQSLEASLSEVLSDSQVASAFSFSSLEQFPPQGFPIAQPNVSSPPEQYKSFPSQEQYESFPVQEQFKSFPSPKQYKVFSSPEQYKFLPSQERYDVSSELYPVSRCVLGGDGEDSAVSEGTPTVWPAHLQLQAAASLDDPSSSALSAATSVVMSALTTTAAIDQVTLF